MPKRSLDATEDPENEPAPPSQMGRRTAVYFYAVALAAGSWFLPTPPTFGYLSVGVALLATVGFTWLHARYPYRWILRGRSDSESEVTVAVILTSVLYFIAMVNLATWANARLAPTGPEHTRSVQGTLVFRARWWEHVAHHRAVIDGQTVCVSNHAMGVATIEVRDGRFGDPWIARVTPNR